MTGVRPRTRPVQPVASSRRSRTNSASRASCGLEVELLEPAAKCSRTASAARSAPSIRSRVPSSSSSASRSTWTTASRAPRRDDDEVAVPGRELLERREQLLALRSALRRGATRCSASRVGRSSPSSLTSSAALASAARSRTPSSSARRRAGRARTPGRDRRPARPRAAPARRSGRLRVEQPREPVEPPRRAPARAPSAPPRAAPARAPRPPRGSPAPTAAGTGRAGSASGSSPAAGPRSSATRTIDRVRRRLLEVLEQRVGGVLVHPVGAEDEVDAPVRASNGRMCRSRRSSRIVVDPDLVAERLEHVQVGMRAPLDPRRVAEQLPGERERRRAASRPRGGPWSRYACAGPSASAAREQALRLLPAQASRSKLSTDEGRDLVGGTRPVDARRCAAGRPRRARGRPGRRGRGSRPPRARSGPGRRRSAAARRGVDEQEEGGVGEQAADDGEVQLEHPVEPEPAGDALVGERRVDVAVADDVRAALERRPDHLAPRAPHAPPRRAPPRPTARSPARRAPARGRARRAPSRRARA